jgi:REP element-mobilizing transposase RayT
MQPDSYKGRRSIRIEGYDYSQVGAYFVTVCTFRKLPIFGKIQEGVFTENELGAIVEQSWEWLSRQYEYVILDAWAVMPNHTHSILIITERDSSAPKRKSLGGLIGAFKVYSTNRINSVMRSPGSQVWQRNYYEHVIRTEDELNRVRQYIADNPLQWDIDRENPLKIGNHSLDKLLYKKRNG